MSTQKMEVLSSVKFLTVIIVAFQISVGCTEINSKLVITDFSKNISSNIVSSSSSFTSTEKPSRLTVKKWQVGRVSRKHYEIVNMLWRKTKIFINPETTTAAERFRRNYPTPTSTIKYRNIKPRSSLKPLFSSSTSSYIEFYYLDDNDERIKRRDSLIPISHKIQQKPGSGNLFIRSPVLSLRVDDHNNNSPPKINFAINKQTTETLMRKRPVIHQKPSIYGFLSNKFQIDLAPIVKSDTFVFNSIAKRIVTTEKYYDNETCPVTTESEISVNSTIQKNTPNTHNSNNTHDEKPSTPYTNITSHRTDSTTTYDKIKFFEMYDQHTDKPITLMNRIVNKDDFENMVIENEIDVNQKVYLEDVDRNIGHHDGTNTKYVKKHIDNLPKPIPTYATNNSNSKSGKKIKFETVVFNANKTETEKSIIEETTYTPLKKRNTWKLSKNSSRIAVMSEYPFAAVYVYEPSQIHCDAAALSPHWLVAAGSCLSRFHRKHSLSEGRSAFVTYCGLNWWQPERVSYVKYSIVHPRFHPKDPTRRFLYNVGLVQVVGSMSSCFGWAPVSLMSHNFAADSDGSMATAVGWGLDRYDVRYTSAELPRLPLSAYDGFVYSASCPGSKAFGKVKLYNDQSSVVKNLYCLTLPPYTGEENDPVHGSLLLVGGKLIALYLQEERRHSILACGG